MAGSDPMFQWRLQPYQPGALRSSWAQRHLDGFAVMSLAQRPPVSSYSQQVDPAAAVTSP
eukprot:COSAG02_NODE_48002_length_337_cov_0.651261_1_plen_59_part_10